MPMIYHSLQSTIFPHLFCAEVCVAASTVPVPRDGLRVEGGHDAKVFTYTVQDKAGCPQMVAHVDAFTGTNLELPLETRHTTNVSASA